MFCITGLKSVDEEEEVVEGDLAVVVEIEGWVPVGMKDRQAERVDETEKIAEIDKLIVQKNDPDSIQKQNPKLTKKEVCYILSQILLLLGGERRIDSFLKNLNLYENSPSGLSDKVRYVFNKLYDEYGENELHKLLLKEMSLSYKHSSKIMTPKYFDRSSQKVELVTL